MNALARRSTIPVTIRNVTVGGDHPIVVQSMTITDYLEHTKDFKDCEVWLRNLKTALDDSNKAELQAERNLTVKW